MNLLMPDVGKLVYFALGTFLGGRLLAKLRG